MKEQYTYYIVPTLWHLRPSEPTLLPTNLPSLIQYNMATSCAASQTLPASLKKVVPVRRRSQGSLPYRPQLDTCLPNIQITSTAYARPLQQTKVLPKLPNFPLHNKTCSFYYHPTKVQDSHPLPPSTQLIHVHLHSPPGQSSTTTNKAPYSRVAILL